MALLVLNSVFNFSQSFFSGIQASYDNEGENQEEADEDDSTEENDNDDYLSDDSYDPDHMTYEVCTAIQLCAKSTAMRFLG